jgi:hypothetical protein
MEAPQVQKPGQVRLYRMPTALERQGDFSQTFDANGRLMFIKDPLSSGACSVTTAARLLPGNIIPTNRLDPNALALLNMMPLPNVARPARVGRAVELHAAGDAGKPAHEQPAALDGRPSGSNSYWLSYRAVQLEPVRIGDHRRAGEVGLLQRQLRVGDSGINGGWNHISANAVNEFGAGIRRATEGFGVKDDSDYAKFTRSDVGFTSAQFHPELNPQGYLPFVRFGLNTTGIDTPTSPTTAASDPRPTTG